MRYLKILKRLCEQSTHHSHRMSCVIVNKNRIIAQGYNQIKTHPRSQHEWSMTHAELHALFRAGDDLEGCIAVVCRVNKQGELRMAKPCPVCSNALKKKGIKKVIFSVENGWLEESLAV